MNWALYEIRSTQNTSMYVCTTCMTCIRDLPKQEFSKVLHGLLSDILERENDCIKTPLILEKVGLKVK